MEIERNRQKKPPMTSRARDERVLRLTEITESSPAHAELLKIKEEIQRRVIRTNLLLQEGTGAKDYEHGKARLKLNAEKRGEEDNWPYDRVRKAIPNDEPFPEQHYINYAIAISEILQLFKALGIAAGENGWKVRVEKPLADHFLTAYQGIACDKKTGIITKHDEGIAELHKEFEEFKRLIELIR